MVYVPGIGDGLATADQAAGRLTHWLRERAKFFTILYVSRRDDLDARVTLSEHADDLIHVVEALDWGPALLEAQSAGGPIGIVAAHKRPDLFPMLTLSSSAAWFEGAITTQAHQWVELIRANNWAALFESAAEFFWRDKRLAMLRSFRSAFSDLIKPQNPQRLEAIFQSLRDVDLRELLPQLSVPTLVTAGEEDRIFDPNIQQEMASLIPSSTLVLTPGYGHGHDWEDPKHAARIAAFARLHKALLAPAPNSTRVG